MGDDHCFVQLAAGSAYDERHGGFAPTVIGDADYCRVVDSVEREEHFFDLARFKVPREIVFLAELPRNATGKVLKRELHEKHDSETT